MQFSWTQNLKLVQIMKFKNNFWVMKLDGCSFQAPHVSPRLRPFSLSSFSSLSLSSLNPSSILLLELEMHILAIIYHHLVFPFLSFFCYKISFQLSHKGWRGIFFFIFLFSFLFIFKQIGPQIKNKQGIKNKKIKFRPKNKCSPSIGITRMLFPESSLPHLDIDWWKHTMFTNLHLYIRYSVMSKSYR